MNRYLTPTYALILFFILIPLAAHAQSISGTIKSLSTTEDLGYANVDIYKETKLVASVLADKEGNFSVQLDTGLYRAEIIYAGYKKITKEIYVRGDEKSNFGLDKDATSTFKEKNRTIKPSYSYDSEDADAISKEDYEGSGAARGLESKGYSAPMMMGSRSRSDSKIPAISNQGQAGTLTAGEINDFSKWDLWTDLKQDELYNHRAAWNFSPEQRYMAQVTDQNGLPLADLPVYLVTKQGTRLFAARTDNTGKAELWQSLLFKQQDHGSMLSIHVLYNGKMHIIKKAKSFGNGNNSIQLNRGCNQSQKVDIAFVVDATGSMSDELSYLTAELNDVIFKSKQISPTLNFSFANVFYRDHQDDYLTRTQDFTRILSESVAFIGEQQAGGGGDFEEAVEVALDSAVNSLNWSTDARARIIFLILDAPPHNTPEIQEKLNRISLQAAEKGIRIVPLVASGIDKGTEYLMRSIALATNGTYAFLTDHSGIGGSHLKPSTDEYEVETLNDLLVRVIKSYTYMPDCTNELPELNLSYPDSSVTYTPNDTTSSDSTTNAPATTIAWKYYPNPTRGIVTIQASVNITELYITDLSGKVLHVIKDIKAENPVRADLSGYASGIYLIRYPVGKQWVSGKVVLMRD
jgi:hypothetical protein